VDFEFSAEQEQLRDSVARFLDARAPLRWVREQLDADAATGDAWHGLADLGVTALLVPEADGGAGDTGMVDAAVVLEELGRALYPGPYAASAIGAASIVALAGDDGDRAAFLPGIAAGATIGTVALLEPGRRATWTAPRTAVSGEGDGWRLDGTKVHVVDLAAAQIAFVTAASPDGVLGVYAVTTDAPGVTVTPTPTVDGTRKQATLTLDGAPGHRLGGSADATDAVAATVDRLSAAAVVDGVGAAARALAMSVEYAKERRQFDAPVGSFQAVQHLCADMLRAVELARAAGYYACWAADAASAAERHRAVTMALAFAADELYTVGASAIQVHAGIGFTWEHDIHLFYKRLLSLQDTGGGSIDQLEELASIVLDVPSRSD
jgi:alkylation response protein AidB-like acyl-CoA dehydrogenase